jgi:hypothetical protein
MMALNMHYCQDFLKTLNEKENILKEGLDK